MNYIKFKLKTFKKSEKGMAFVESIPALFTVVLIFNFSVGFFGAIHSGILNNIGSYNYAMETFRFRSDLMYFRPGGGTTIHYAKAMNRVHGIIQEGNETDEQKDIWPATVRSMRLDRLSGASSDDNAQTHLQAGGDQSVWAYKSESGFDGSMPTIGEIYVKTVYGICLNADCEVR